MNLILERHFIGLPVVVVFDKEQGKYNIIKGINIKDLINFFELYKVKDRASMIK
jgi:hypothetical protein